MTNDIDWRFRLLYSTPLILVGAFGLVAGVILRFADSNAALQFLGRSFALVCIGAGTYFFFIKKHDYNIDDLSSEKVAV